LYGGALLLSTKKKGSWSQGKDRITSHRLRNRDLIILKRQIKKQQGFGAVRETKQLTLSPP
jgi:hypothetical protein